MAKKEIDMVKEEKKLLKDIKRRAKKMPHQVIQNHHCIYGDGQHEEALLIKLRKGEHRVITLINGWCRRNVSTQFIRLLHYTAARLEMDRTINKIDLDKEEK